MVLFDERGIRIIEKGGRYYLGYEAGEIAVYYEEIEISKEDAERVMQDVMYSVQVVWNYKNRRRGLI